MSMTKKFFITTAVLLCAVLTLFTSCNDDDDKKDYADLLIGKQWLYLNKENTDMSFIVYFGSDGNMYRETTWTTEERGTEWVKQEAPYTREGELLEIKGKTNTGAGTIAVDINVYVNYVDDKIAIVTIPGSGNMSNQRFTMSQEITLQRTEEKTSDLLGYWKILDEETGEPVTFFYFKPNNESESLEYEDGQWVHYEYEKSYLYTNLSVGVWKDIPNDPNAFNYAQVREVNKIDNDTYTFTTKERGEVAYTFTMYRSSLEETPR